MVLCSYWNLEISIGRDLLDGLEARRREGRDGGRIDGHEAGRGRGRDGGRIDGHEAGRGRGRDGGRIDGHEAGRERRRRKFTSTSIIPNMRLFDVLFFFLGINAGRRRRRGNRESGRERGWLFCHGRRHLFEQRGCNTLYNGCLRTHKNKSVILEVY